MDVEVAGHSSSSSGLAEDVVQKSVTPSARLPKGGSSFLDPLACLGRLEV